MVKLRKHGQISRNERRKDAEERQKYYNSLTLQEKMDRLPVDGESKRELGKLRYEIQYGRKKTKGNPTNIKKRKDDKPSRRDRWETKQKG